MTPEEFVQLLRTYNFVNKSVRSFAQEYGVSPKTVTKYLRENDIPYQKRVIVHEIPRNRMGNYMLVIRKKNVPAVSNERKPVASQRNKQKNDRIEVATGGRRPEVDRNAEYQERLLKAIS